MTWTYSQSTGELQHNGEFVGNGYSGTGFGRNNPAYQETENYGPIPEGLYTIGTAHDDPVLGPCIMALHPNPATDTFKRSGFYLHGNNKNNDASHGCIVLGPLLRHSIASSPDTELEVIP